jgi:hypothetical protein
VNLDDYGIPLVFALAAIFIAWFFAGAVVNRRRLAQTARWVRRALDDYRLPEPSKSTLSIKWISTNAFIILLEGARHPFTGLAATALLRSRDMVTIWLLDRIVGRRDLLMLRCELPRLPIWGVEIFRPRSILSGDIRQTAKREGWPIESAASGPLMTAHGGGKAGELCSALLDALGDRRQEVVRLAIHRRAPHLTLALDLPDPTSADPRETMQLAERLATITLGYCTP